MTRNWILCGSPAAFLAGLLMVHCSSSTTTTSSSSSTSTSSSSSSSASSSATTSKISSSSSGIKDAGPAGDVFNSHPGDTDASCKPTEGGLFCTPGTVSCGGDASCKTATDICCDVPGTGETCQAPTAACTGTKIACDEAADCPEGQICCIHSTGTAASTAAVTCEPAPTCPDPAGSIAAQQICRSDTECPPTAAGPGSCNFWNCLTNIIQACANPVPSSPSLCTKM